MTIDQEQYDELIRVLYADISALIDLIFPTGRMPSDAEIRIMATVMRRWLIDGDLKKILAPLRHSALFEVQDNRLAQKYAATKTTFRYYLTAGILANGNYVAHVYESQLPSEDAKYDLYYEKRVSYNLKHFLRQPRMFFQDNWFTTEQIIRFAANKMGGNHLDFDRVGEWARLEAGNRFIRFGGPADIKLPAGCEIYLVIEPLGDDILGGVHLEVLAAAASFVQLKIGGEPLYELRFEKDLIGRLRSMFRRTPEIRMVQRSRSG